MDPDFHEDKAKEAICGWIDKFINERIVLAQVSYI